jgi:radical SAM-linked protein
MVAMVAESTRSVNSRSSGASTPGVPKSQVTPAGVPTHRYKYRLRFRKGGDLRLVSHHDLMHVFERMMRRAALPICYSQGFHPQPRMVFALSLALGVTGANEVLEIELTELLDPEHLLDRLARQAPPGLEIRAVVRLEGKSSSLVRRALYCLPLELRSKDMTYAGAVSEATDDFGRLIAGLSERCRRLLEQPHLWVQRSRPQPRRLDIRPYLHGLHVHGGKLDMDVLVTPTGTARPEEYARLLGLDLLLEAGAVIERRDLEMMDETAEPFSQTSANPKLRPDKEEEAVQQLPRSAPRPAPAARPTALLPGPLSFDS